MHPTLLEFPFFPYRLPTYGFLVALGFLVGMFWVRHEAKRLRESPDLLLDLCFYILLSSIVGARLYYVFFEEEVGFWKDPKNLIQIWSGGLSFYGGLIGATLASVFFIRKHRLSFWKAGDICMPGLAIGHAIGRLGCFAAGCCHGKPAPADSWFSVVFPLDPHGVAPVGIPLYPTQLFEAAAEVLIFLLLVLARYRKKKDGEILLLYLILYPLVRIGIEFLRGDLARDLVFQGPFSVAQYTSAGFVLAAVAGWFYLKSRSSKNLNH